MTEDELIEAKKKIAKKIAKRAQLFSAIVSIATLIGILIAFYSSVSDISIITKPNLSLDYYRAQFDELEKTMNELSKQNADFEKSFLQIEKSIPKDSLRIEIAKLHKSMDIIQTQIDEIHGIIMNDPVKVLTVTSLKNDFTNLSEKHNNEFIMLQKEIDRISNYNIWLIGLLFTTWLALIGLIVSNYITNKKVTS